VLVAAAAASVSLTVPSLTIVLTSFAACTVAARRILDFSIRVVHRQYSLVIIPTRRVRNALAELEVETIQQREGRWVLADLEGKGRRIRTVAVPIWVKQGIEVWKAAAGIDKGRLLRSVSKSGKVNRDSLSDWVVWSVVEQSSKQIGIEHFGAHDLHRTCAKLCRKSDGDLVQIKFLLGHSSIQTT
jgi:integrase